MNYEEIKYMYMYMRDAKNADRVLTIARKLVPSDVSSVLKLHVGWSLNKRPNLTVEKAKHLLKSSDHFTILSGKQDFDHYDKKEGRRWADERLQKEPLEIEVPAGVRPSDQVVCSLLDHPNFYVRRIVRQYFETNKR